MTDYSEEIAALKAAIASGAKRVTTGQRTVEYDSFSALMARLRFLEGEQNAGVPSARLPTSGFASFDRGDC